MNSNPIIVFNDNQMSIVENHGGMYRNVKELRDSNDLREDTSILGARSFI